jgi:hypothetical protein
MKGSKIFSILALVVLFIANTNAQTFSEIQKIVPADRNSSRVFGNSISVSGSYAVVGSGNLSHNGAYVYEDDGTGTWTEVQKLIASDAQSSDYFGYSVSVSGNYAIVSAREEDHDAIGNNYLNKAGSAYIFERNGSGTWIEVQKIVASDRATNDQFGWSVAISGNIAIVGAKQEDEDENGNNSLFDAGSVYIFERDGGGNWNEVQKIVASDRSNADFFGTSVAIDGNYLTVGASADDDDANGGNPINYAGSAYVFEQNGFGIWNEVQKIDASDRSANSYFGFSVAINGSYLISGAYGESNNGAAYVYERNGVGVWNEVQKLVASDIQSFDYFGQTVSVSGNHAAIGSPNHVYDENSQNMITDAGAAYIFERDGAGTWNEFQKIVNSDRANGDKFGGSVSIDQDFILSSAIWEDHDENGLNYMSKAGSAYIFKICYETTHNISIAMCDSYTVPSGDETYSITGTYTDTLTNAGGCDSVITINLTITNSNSSSETVASCDNYTWAATGNTYSTSGTYNTTLINSQGCDSLVTLNLTINSSNLGSETVTTCDTYTWAANGNTYTSSGTYNATLSNALGCDSLVTLNLTISNSTNSSETITTCDSYTWPTNGNTYTNSGTFYTTLSNAVGCDSIVTLNLTINNSNTGSETIAACNSYTWPTSGNTYTNSGTFYATLTNAVGCDSIVTLNLTINNSNTGSETIAACNSYTWPASGNTYTNSGTFYTTITNVAGCDSLVTLNLTINTNNSGSETITTCDNYFWSASGNTYTASGTFFTTLSNAAGCDSIVTLNLTINNADASITQSGALLTANAPGVSYQWVTCPSMAPISGETNQSFTATASGDYAVIVTQNGCTDTSACTTVTLVGIKDNEFENQVVVYPNPTQGVFAIDLGNTFPEITVSINDVVGKLIRKQQFYESRLLNLSIEQPAGVYFIKLEVEDKQAIIKLVKQ